MQVIYLTIKQSKNYCGTNSGESSALNLPSFVISRVNSYKNQNARNDSFNAWLELNRVLKTVSGCGLISSELSFSNRGKPLISNGAISLSHSNGAVAVGYSKMHFGVDIEKVTNANKYQAVAKKLGVDVSDEQLFLKWTEIESVAKLNDKFSTKLSGNEFIKSFFVYVCGEKYAVSVACNESFKIEFLYN